MFEPGLVSVSFRQHTPAEILEAAARAGLRCIEWGGDVHLPPGNRPAAEQLRLQTADAGLRVSSYGLYFRIGVDPVSAFLPVLETAEALRAPIVRVWAYDRPLSGTDERTLDRLAAEAAQIADLAKARGIRVGLECHGGTLTETYPDALRFLQMAGENLAMYWQPNQARDFAYNLAAAKALAPFTLCLHVFQWDAAHRYPLAEGRAVWTEYLQSFSPSGGTLPLLLEFMPDDRLESLEKEAAALLSLLM